MRCRRHRCEDARCGVSDPFRSQDVAVNGAPRAQQPRERPESAVALGWSNAGCAPAGQTPHNRKVGRLIHSEQCPISRVGTGLWGTPVGTRSGYQGDQSAVRSCEGSRTSCSAAINWTGSTCSRSCAQPGPMPTAPRTSRFGRPAGCPRWSRYARTLQRRMRRCVPTRLLDDVDAAPAPRSLAGSLVSGGSGCGGRPWGSSRTAMVPSTGPHGAAWLATASEQRVAAAVFLLGMLLAAGAPPGAEPLARPKDSEPAGACTDPGPAVPEDASSVGRVWASVRDQTASKVLFRSRLPGRTG